MRPSPVPACIEAAVRGAVIMKAVDVERRQPGGVTVAALCRGARHRISLRAEGMVASSRDAWSSHDVRPDGADEETHLGRLSPLGTAEGGEPIICRLQFSCVGGHWRRY